VVRHSDLLSQGLKAFVVCDDRKRVAFQRSDRLRVSPSRCPSPPPRGDPAASSNRWVRVYRHCWNCAGPTFMPGLPVEPRSWAFSSLA
jgi:hypothetical protein